MEALETEEVGKYVVEVHYDENPSSPREWDNLTIIRGWHRRCTIGDGPDLTGWADESGPNLADLLELIESDDGPVVMLAPLYWYEHSGQTCKIGAPIDLAKLRAFGDADLVGDELRDFQAQCMDSAGWDSGTAGIVYVTEKTQAMCGTPDELIEEVARAETEEYARWCEGMVFGYCVVEVTECDHGDEHRDVVDSCWGFIGDTDYAMQEGIAAAESLMVESA